MNPGTSILMAKVLATYAADGNRSLWSCDSFRGLPAEDNDMMRIANDTVAHGNIIGQGLDQLQGVQGQFASSRHVFECNIKAHGLEEQLKRGKIKILEGFFIDTLPTAPISKISFLRSDGDIFVSTWQAFVHLYSKVTIGVNPNY